MGEAKYKRVLLKLSGEALAGDNKFGFDKEILANVCKNIKEMHDLGVEIAIVVGGGNIWRGRFGPEMERTTADYMGMLATVMNALAIQDCLEQIGVTTAVQTSIEMREIAEPYVRRKAVKHLEHGRVVIFAGGTGNPYFTTDTAAALRACEICADAILVGKTTHGIYDSDPKLNPNAVKFDRITYIDVLEKELKVMDSAAISLAKDNSIPLIVFGIAEPENIIKAVCGEQIGTIVKGEF